MEGIYKRLKTLHLNGSLILFISNGQPLTYLIIFSNFNFNYALTNLCTLFFTNSRTPRKSHLVHSWSQFCWLSQVHTLSPGHGGKFRCHPRVWSHTHTFRQSGWREVRQVHRWTLARSSFVCLYLLIATDVSSAIYVELLSNAYVWFYVFVC